jgi:hypothetical protein
MNEVIAHEMLSPGLLFGNTGLLLFGSIAETDMVVELFRVDEDRKE